MLHKLILTAAMMAGAAIGATTSTYHVVTFDGANLYSSAGTNVLQPIAIGELDFASDRLTQYAKYHNTNTFTFTAADTWHDITFNFKPPTENSFGIGLSTNDTKTISFDYNGHTQINGCLRPQWNGGAATVVRIASRIVFSADSWATTNEARCLQATITRERQVNEVGLLAYNGSLTVATNMQIRLQGQVSNTNMTLQGWSGFDNPTAASINIFTVGKPPQE